MIRPGKRELFAAVEDVDDPTLAIGFTDPIRLGIGHTDVNDMIASALGNRRVGHDDIVGTHPDLTGDR